MPAGPLLLALMVPPGLISAVLLALHARRPNALLSTVASGCAALLAWAALLAFGSWVRAGSESAGGWEVEWGLLVFSAAGFVAAAILWVLARQAAARPA